MGLELQECFEVMGTINPNEQAEKPLRSGTGWALIKDQIKGLNLYRESE